MTPRKGTISPWSSKATDIFRNCGLAGIARVERGIRFRIKPAFDRSDAQLLNALHDRMTEGVYDTLDDLFDCPPPRPGRTFDVMAKGVAAIREANAELGLAISDCDGILITHEHSDHVKGLSTFLKKNPLPVYATRSSARSSSSTAGRCRTRSSG